VLTNSYTSMFQTWKGKEPILKKKEKRKRRLARKR
jgi:hypothetical protein